MNSIKLTDRDTAAQLVQTYRSQRKVVGFTSGVFDILHSGHVQYLNVARGLCVQSNKGPERPICPQSERALVLSGLSSVDHVFIFDESNNNTNIELLKPDIYIKAGDYSKEKLSSASIVEKHGGRVELVGFKSGQSTTSVIERIKLLERCDSGDRIEYQRRPAVFLDRDGTINEHIEYLSEPERFQEIPGAFAAIKRFQDLGFRIIIVTNQPGIGLGYFSKEDFYAVTREMMRRGSAVGCAFDKIYFCPHSKADNCGCRKPGVKFIQRAITELNIDRERSFVIGDMTSDIKLGTNAGCRTILVKTGRGGDDKIYQVEPTYTVKDLAAAAELVAELGDKA
jgi:D-glycero-D-manno-heptose 1,7-bisphosphate phosphatase